MVVSMIVFDFVAMIAILGFMMHTLRSASTVLRYVQDPIYNSVRNQMLFRRTLLVACHLFIAIYYLFEFF